MTPVLYFAHKYNIDDVSLSTLVQNTMHEHIAH